jgi:hypothetical protein
MRVLAVLTVAVALALPAVAGAQSSPFAPIPQQPAPPPQAPAPPRDVSDPDDGLKGWQQALILLGAVVLVGAITVAILGDARRSAPPTERETEGLEDGLPPREAAERRRQKAKQRQRQKAARQARKRNR